MTQKVFVFFKTDEKQVDDKKLRLEEKLPGSQFIFHNSVPKKLPVNDLIGNRVILDFDISDPSHLSLLDLLKTEKDKNISMDFLVDILSESDFVPVMTKKLKEKIDKFVEMLMPLRESISNKFLQIPEIQMVDKELVFSHLDDKSLYFFSNKDLFGKDGGHSVWYTDEGKTTEIVCTGDLLEIDPFDEDKSDKIYYELILDDNSWEQLKEYYDRVEELNDVLEKLFD